MAESSAKRKRVDDGGGSEVPPLLDEEGWFSDAVCAALSYYDEDMLQRITDNYPVNAQDRRGTTLLMWAASEGFVASIRFLIERGAAVNIQEDEDKWTVLHCACNGIMSGERFQELVLLLLRAGADPTIKDVGGRTPRDTGK